MSMKPGDDGNSPSPRDFHHPYQPYDIQTEFMNGVYECIQQGKVGIFESPTGTGKSLSLICGSLTWLREHELDSVSNKDPDSDDEPSWILEHAKSARRSDVIERKTNLEHKLRRIRDKENQQRKRYESGEALPKRQRLIASQENVSMKDEEADFLLEDYESDTEQAKVKQGSIVENGLSGKSLELAVKLGLASDTSKTEDEELEEQTKIFFCSRTHSQLIQFADEIRKVKIPFVQHDVASLKGENLVEVIKHLSLGSRNNLCINEDVRKFGSTTAINERCLDLQQTKNNKKKCSYLPNKETETLVHQFRDHTMARIRDIEDLAKLGQKIGICPYYASRASIKPSEIVTLPYPLMLQKSARQAMDISLKSHIVIIDEAHNLMDAIAEIYSVQISLHQLRMARTQLTTYLQKFRNRLKGKNRVYVAQTIRLIDSLVVFLDNIASQTRAVAEGVVNAASLLTGKGADQINLYKLNLYLQESKLARKVDGYTLYSVATDAIHAVQDSRTPVLTQCQGFFQALTYPAAEGRFFFHKDNQEVILNYMLLDPANHFKDVVEEARAVILAGGTMSPMDDYKNHLFPYLDPTRLMTLSCGHVIPQENLIALPMSACSSGMDLEFTFEKRNSPQLIDGLGETIVELASVIPDGVVIFFPSYAYLEQVVLRWKVKLKGESIFDKMNIQKTVVYESRSEAATTDDVLERYSSFITSQTDTRGAILLSVVGGKLSEGINFSDKLGRGVFVIGLPFPNIQSVEWKAKLDYIEQQATSRGCNAVEARTASRTFYENACMRAVNQCIGRAIRHRNDYAGIFLLDKRYNTPRIQSKLPGWIQSGIASEASKMRFEQVKDKVRLFFEMKKV